MCGWGQGFGECRRRNPSGERPQVACRRHMLLLDFPLARLGCNLPGTDTRTTSRPRTPRLDPGGPMRHRRRVYVIVLAEIPGMTVSLSAAPIEAHSHASHPSGRRRRHLPQPKCLDRDGTLVFQAINISRIPYVLGGLLCSDHVGHHKHSCPRVHGTKTPWTAILTMLCFNSH